MPADDALHANGDGAGGPGVNVDSLVESLAQETSPLARRRLLMSAKELWSAGMVERFYDEALKRMHVDLPQAERMARSASWLSEKVKDDASRAMALRAMGNILERKRRYVEALKQFEQALEVFERLGDEMEIARTLNFCLHCLIYVGRYDDAMASAARAEDITIVN